MFSIILFQLATDLLTAFRMSLVRLCFCCATLLCVSSPCCFGEVLVNKEGVTDDADSSVNWRGWSDDVFREAITQNKFVMLLLGAPWSEETVSMREHVFSNSQVAKLANQSYIPVWVDVENQLIVKHLFAGSIFPKLVILTPQKRIVASFDGFRSASKTHLFLYNILKKNSYDLIDTLIDLGRIDSAILSPHQRLRLLEHFSSRVDWYGGGYYEETRLLPESMLFFLLAQESNKQYEELAKRTLTANFQLFDPVWGGVYRTSKFGTWQKPTFEKLALDQAKNIVIYSLAFMKDGEAKFRSAGLSVADYLDKWLLAPEGVYYSGQSGFVTNKTVSSQDYFSYDDEHRRAFGIPEVHKEIRADVNGRIAEALLMLARASGRENLTEKAKKIVEWCMANLRLEGSSGFKHNRETPTPPFLIDNMNIARAMLALYETEQDRKWLRETTNVLDYIEETFFESKGNQQLSGAVVGVGEKDIDGGSRRSVPENCELTRLAIRTYYYTMNPKYKNLAQRSLAFIVALNQDMQAKFADSILLAYQEFNETPLQFALLGKKGDERARSLLQTALRYPHFMKRIDQYDPSEISSLQTNIAFPPVTIAAIFACVDRHCTQAIFQPEDLEKALTTAGLK